MEEDGEGNERAEWWWRVKRRLGYRAQPLLGKKKLTDLKDPSESETVFQIS
jgi:hypothetical protein